MKASTGQPVKRQPLTILICSMFLSLTVFFFSPMEVFLGNMKEITVPFRNVWWMQLLAAVALALALWGIAMILPGRPGMLCAGGMLGVGVACYVQMLCMNGGMPTMIGDSMNVTPTQEKLNLAAWFGIIVIVALAVFLLCRKYLKQTSLAVRFLACALAAMQAVGIVGAVLTNDTSEMALEHNLSKEGEFVLSGDTNVIEFVIDSADTTFFDQMLERYPEVKDSLSGWVWYTNATSSYSRTYPSFTYMLTGQHCRFDKPFATYVSDAFGASSFLEGIHNGGTDIRIFTSDPQFVAKSADPYVANSVPFLYSDIRNMRIPVLEKNLIKMAFYKCLPYAFKNRFRYDITEINSDSFQPGYSSRDDDFYRDLKAHPLTVTGEYGKAYRVYYLQGIHPGANWDENLNTTAAGWDENRTHPVDGKVEGPELPDTLRGSFRYVESFIGQLKALGIYDKATIIVTADHGRGIISGNHGKLESVYPVTPVLLVKYPGSDTTKPLETSSAPVSHDDLFALVEQGTGTPVSGTGSGKTPAEIPEDGERDRYFYLSAYRTSRAGEVALLEYLIRGNARDLNDWSLTGNWWDIIYSANIVSPEEFSGF